MTTNRLSSPASSGNFVSAYRACEWAAMARARGYLQAADAWDRADREGWDELHYSPERLREITEKAAEQRRK